MSTMRAVWLCLAAELLLPACAPRPKESHMQTRPIPEMLGAVMEFRLGKEVTHRSLPIRAPAGPAGLKLGHYFLRIENVTSSKQAPPFAVYPNLPEAADPAKFPELCIDSMETFGLMEASRPRPNHAANGMTYSFDATKTLLALEATKRWDGKTLRVTFVPGRWDGEVDVRVGRLSLYIE